MLIYLQSASSFVWSVSGDGAIARPPKLPTTFLTGSARQIAQLVGATAAHPPQSPRQVLKIGLNQAQPKRPLSSGVLSLSTQEISKRNCESEPLVPRPGDRTVDRRQREWALHCLGNMCGSMHLPKAVSDSASMASYSMPGLGDCWLLRSGSADLDVLPRPYTIIRQTGTFAQVLHTIYLNSPVAWPFGWILWRFRVSSAVACGASIGACAGTASQTALEMVYYRKCHCIDIVLMLTCPDKAAAGDRSLDSISSLACCFFKRCWQARQGHA